LFQRGRDAFDSDDHVQAMAWYRKAAEAGEARGMRKLGVMYETGSGGLADDDEQAVAWYRKAAEAGDVIGMMQLAFMYENERGGLAKDDVQAVAWYHKAAELGDEDAQQALRRLGVS
jgi:uncharacterized protein